MKTKIQVLAMMFIAAMAFGACDDDDKNDANWTLYNGSKRLNTLKQQRMNNRIAELGVAESENTIEEADTRPLPDARRVHDDEHHEHGKQPESKNKKVLGTEPFELHLTAHAFVYLKVRHKLLSFICS